MDRRFATRLALLLTSATGLLVALTACVSPPAPCHDTVAGNASPGQYDYEQPPAGGGYACLQNAIPAFTVFTANWDYNLSVINDYREANTPTPSVEDAVDDMVFTPARAKWLDTGASIFLPGSMNTTVGPAVSLINDVNEIHMINLSPTTEDGPAKAFLRTNGAGQVLECDIHFYKESHTSSASHPIPNGITNFRLTSTDSWGPGPVMPHVLQHEMGHCLGLAHQGWFNHTDSVMSEVWGGTADDTDPFFSNGDRDALKYLYGP